MNPNLDIKNLLKSVEENVIQIQKDGAPFNLELYLSRNLPLKFPNRGILELVKSDVKVEIYHELFLPEDFLKNANGNNIESFIDHYGNSHQRDFCYLKTGHRFGGVQTIQFRGVLGINRLYKLLLMLRLVGFEYSRIVFVDTNPDYESIIERDLRLIPKNTELVLIGGQVVVRKMLGVDFVQRGVIRGNIVSYGEYSHNGKTIILTSYPYGDLSEKVVQSLSQKKIHSFVFVGSAGSLKEDLEIGNIVVPKAIIGTDGKVKTQKFCNSFTEMKRSDIKFSNFHSSVITPLVETKSFINEMKNNRCESVDVEAAYFQSGCENWLPDSCRTALMFYITDQPNTKNSIAQHDYSNGITKIARIQMGSILTNELKILLNN